MSTLRAASSTSALSRVILVSQWLRESQIRHHVVPIKRGLNINVRYKDLGRMSQDNCVASYLPDEIVFLPDEM